MEKKRIEEIRIAVAALRRDGGRPHYSKGIRSSVEKLLIAGARLSELANQTGISRGTLVGWSKQLSGKNFRAVRIKEVNDQDDVGLRVALPGGVRIEGVSVENLSRVLECCK